MLLCVVWWFVSTQELEEQSMEESQSLLATHEDQDNATAEVRAWG